MLKGKVFNCNEEVINAVNAELIKLKKNILKTVFRSVSMGLRNTIESIAIM